MSLNPNQSGGTPRELPEIGGHSARNFGIIDIGSHKSVFNGIEKVDSKGNTVYVPKVMLFFELTQFMHTYKEGEPAEPCVIAQEYTFYNTDKAKLPKVMMSWGKLKEPPTELNIKPYLGRWCDLGIMHSKDGKYANIQGNGLSVNPSRLKQGDAIPVKIKENILFDLDEFSWKQFYKVPLRAQKLIRECKEWPNIIKKYPEPIKDGQADISNDDFDAVADVLDEDGLPF